MFDTNSSRSTFINVFIIYSLNPPGSSALLFMIKTWFNLNANIILLNEARKKNNFCISDHKKVKINLFLDS